MSQAKPKKHALSLRAVARSLPLLLPAVSALVPMDVVWAAAPKGANLQALAQAVVRGDDTITPEHLRALLMAKRKDFTLIDIRSPAAFAAAHIDGATNIPLARLLEESAIVRLRRVPQVVVYGDRTEGEAQAATLLRVAGVPALALAGGLAGWAQKVQAWSGNSDTFQIVRALNDCPSAEPAAIPPLNSVVPQAVAVAQPASQAAPAATAIKPSGRVRLKGVC